MRDGRRGIGAGLAAAALEPLLGTVVKAYLIGHSARDFALQIGDLPHEICETMERAVARAASLLAKSVTRWPAATP